MAHFICSKYNSTKCHIAHCRVPIPRDSRMYFDNAAPNGSKATCVDCAGKLYGVTDPDPTRKLGKRLPLVWRIPHRSGPLKPGGRG